MEVIKMNKRELPQKFWDMEFKGYYYLRITMEKRDLEEDT